MTSQREAARLARREHGRRWELSALAALTFFTLAAFEVLVLSLYEDNSLARAWEGVVALTLLRMSHSRVWSARCRYILTHTERLAA